MQPASELCPSCGRWVERLHARTGWCMRCTGLAQGRGVAVCPDCGKEHVLSAGHKVCSGCREKRYRAGARPSGARRRCPLCNDGWRLKDRPLCDACTPYLPLWREATLAAERAGARYHWNTQKRLAYAVQRVRHQLNAARVDSAERRVI